MVGRAAILGHQLASRVDVVSNSRADGLANAAAFAVLVVGLQRRVAGMAHAHQAVFAIIVSRVGGCADGDLGLIAHRVKRNAVVPVVH